MSKRTRFEDLRTELRQREAHSRSIHGQIRQAAGEERMHLWEAKREYGRATRGVLLLYAFLRKRARVRAEPVHMLEQNPWLQYLIVREAKRLGREVDTNALDAWMKGAEQVPVETAAAE